MTFRLESTRRDFLRISIAGGTLLVLNGCGRDLAQKSTEQSAKESSKPGNGEKGGEVTATEDLMREHGVLRRALLVYSEAAAKLRTNPSAVSAESLLKTAKLFRAFGEEYHERKLEEVYIFPAVKKAGGPAAAYPDILLAQHSRGREITDYILAVTQGAKLGSASAEQFAGALEALVRMYR